jgi:manganese efflux pump family protein
VPVLTLVLAAVAVGLGNFGASIGIGLSGVAPMTRLKVGLVFGVFEAGMPLVGLLAGRGIAGALGHAARYCGGALLIAIGAWQLLQTVRAGRTGLAPQPIVMRRLLLTALALSTDNVVVGFSLGIQRVSVVEAVVVFAVVSVGLSLLGLELGRRLATAAEFASQYLAGFVLLAVGVLIAVGEL